MAPAKPAAKKLRADFAHPPGLRRLKGLYVALNTVSENVVIPKYNAEKDDRDDEDWDDVCFYSAPDNQALSVDADQMRARYKEKADAIMARMRADAEALDKLVEELADAATDLCGDHTPGDDEEEEEEE